MKLYQHQKEIVNDNKQKVGLWLGTGSGKSLIAAFMAKGKTLVVCPKTVKEDNVWIKAFKQTEEIEDKKKAEGYIITKDQIKLAKNKWIFDKKWNTIIIDEAHQCAGISPSTYQKNKVKYPKSSQIYQTILKLIELNPSAKVFPLTATPTANPMVVYGLSRFLGKKYNFNEFRDFFYYEFKTNIFITRKTQKEKDRLAKVVNVLGYVSRLQDYVDVPKQTFQTISVALTTEQNKALKEIKLIYPDPLVQIGKVHQIEQGGWHTDEEQKILKQNKTNAIIDLKKEYKRVIVFCKYTAQINNYIKILEKKHKVFVLTGKTKNREEVLAKSNDEDCILLVQSSISAGYELPNFRCMIFASYDYSFVNKVQAEGRILRLNALKNNLYVTLLAGDIDKAVYNTVMNKEDFHIETYLQKNNN